MIELFAWIIIVFIALCAVLLCLYFLFFLRPRKIKSVCEKLFCDYAHRGLHGEGIPENSLSAFKKAMDEGVGIELDVQLSKDGKIVVFHDYSLLRMTGETCSLSEKNFHEIQTLKLGKTEETIPSFEEVLSLVNGKVPLLVELKGENFDTSLCEKVGKLLKEYNGDYCVESFNPLLLREMKRYLPNAFCGLLYTNVCRDKNKKSVLNLLLSLMAFNFLAKPNFIAYNKLDRNSFPVKTVKKLYDVPSFVWTVKTEEEARKAKSHGEYSIFEISFES